MAGRQMLTRNGFEGTSDHRVYQAENSDFSLCGLDTFNVFSQRNRDEGTFFPLKSPATVPLSVRERSIIQLIDNGGSCSAELCGVHHQQTTRTLSKVNDFAKFIETHIN